VEESTSMMDQEMAANSSALSVFSTYSGIENTV
jgi:hypothetical protein